jgi:hypothetical protein
MSVVQWLTRLHYKQEVAGSRRFKKKIFLIVFPFFKFFSIFWTYYVNPEEPSMSMVQSMQSIYTIEYT